MSVGASVGALVGVPGVGVGTTKPGVVGDVVGYWVSLFNVGDFVGADEGRLEGYKVSPKSVG